MVHESATDVEVDCEYKEIEENKDSESTEKNDVNVVEDVLMELSFGKFQILNYILVSLVLFAFGMNIIVYVFTAMNSEYR